MCEVVVRIRPQQSRKMEDVRDVIAVQDCLFGRGVIKVVPIGGDAHNTTQYHHSLLEMFTMGIGFKIGHIECQHVSICSEFVVVFQEAQISTASPLSSTPLCEVISKMCTSHKEKHKGHVYSLKITFPHMAAVQTPSDASKLTNRPCEIPSTEIAIIIASNSNTNSGGAIRDNSILGAIVLIFDSIASIYICDEKHRL